jgi:histidinol-phosphate aminotransferase
VEYLCYMKNQLKDISLGVLNSYPNCAILYKKIASYLKVSANNLLLGAGSDGIIKNIFETFVSIGDNVIYPEPTFAMYSIYCDIFGAESCEIKYKRTAAGLELDIGLFVKKIQEKKPKLVCLPNPDSPTGTLIEHENLIKIIEETKKVNGIILIDEAYYHYVEYTVLPLVLKYPHLIVSRTFSKAWGLAGARVGIAIANYDLVSIIHKVRPMYEIGAISASIVIKALDHVDAMLASVERLNIGKKYFVYEMKKLGFSTLETFGNFQHVNFGQQRELIHEALQKLVLYRKDFPDTVLEGYSRFSSTTQEQFQFMVDAMKIALQSQVEPTK